MYPVIAIVAFLAIGGCAPKVVHTERCQDPAGGYQSCQHKIVVDYRTETACTGSCR